MEHIIIGTDGHIDHGKTELIRALTGRDTDTLKEETRRGITIDLGFTWFDLPGGNRAGVIDVPGHEKFLPNMLAGVCGMDLVLLVIAMDEGIMPQTREHMDILSQLNVPGGIVVLTKMDLVDPEWADMMEEEIREELSGTPFAGWPVMRVSSVRDSGIKELKEKMIRMARELKRNRNIQGRFRLPVDRLFTVHGFGTVIAGTLLEGVVHCEDEVMIYPGRQLARVRSIQVHGETVSSACAGQRVALNIAGIKKEELHRGCVAAWPESLQLTERLDVLLQLTADTVRTVKNQSRLHLHIGTAETVCRVMLLNKNELKAGENCYAQLMPETVLAVKRGDRFIVRFYSPLETVGGGIVLDEHAGKHKRYDDAVLDYLYNIENDKSHKIVLQKLCASLEKPVTLAELEKQTRMPAEQLGAVLEELLKQQECVCLPGKKRPFFWVCEGEDQAWRELEALLKAYHQNRPYSRGMEKSLLKKNSSMKLWEPDRFEAYLDVLQKVGRIRGEGNLLCLWNFTVSEDEQARTVLEVMCRRIREAGFDLLDREQLYPAKGDDGNRREQEKSENTCILRNRISVTDREDLLDYFSSSGKLVKVGEDFYTTPEQAAEVRRRVLEYFEKHETLSFSSLRDLLGNTRKSAKPFMAYLDEAKVTAWCGKGTERVKGVVRTGEKQDLVSAAGNLLVITS